VCYAIGRAERALREIGSSKGQPAINRAERLVGRGLVDLHCAAQEEVGIEIAQRQVGIGHRRVRTAAAVTGRSRLRAAALGADIQRAEIGFVRDRTAARADLDQLDGRDLHRQARAAQEALLARGFEAVGHERFAIVDQGELRRRATHVKGQHPFEAGIASEPGACQRTGSRTAFEQLHRHPLGLAHVRQAAVGQHQEQSARDALAAQRVLEPLEIDLGERADVGVGHRRRDAQVFADLRRDLGRE